jgi:3-oxoadipate enol-lactonase
LREQVREMITRNFERATGQDQSQPLPLEPPALARLDEIQVPTLVVVGEQDTPETLASAELLAQSIRGARNDDLPGSAHLPSMEHPELFYRLAIEFLRSHELS